MQVTAAQITRQARHLMTDDVVTLGGRLVRVLSIARPNGSEGGVLFKGVYVEAGVGGVAWPVTRWLPRDIDLPFHGG